MELRDYQREMIARVRACFAGGKKRVCAVAPTGAGKGVMAAWMIAQATKKGHRCLFAVHRSELVDQLVERLVAFGIPAGQIIGKRAENRSHPVQVASIQSILRRTHPPASFVFLDECHHAAAASYSRLLDLYPSAWVVGWSATPCRLDGKPLKMFEELVLGPSVEDLCAAGTLVRPVVYSHPRTPSLVGIPIRAGDFQQEKLAEAVMAPGLVGSLVEHWREHGRDLPTIAFAASIRHSLAIVADFRAAGIPSEHVDGATVPLERAAVIERWKTGATRVVSNVSLFGEGFDFPELAVCVMARPTASRTVYMQQTGRIMRPAPGKSTAIVLDHSANAGRFGLVTDPVEWSLEGKVRAPPAPGHTTCTKCFRVNPVGTARCPECGTARIPVQREDLPDVAAGKLVKFSPEDRRKWYEDMVRAASDRGWKLGAARIRYKEKFGVFPVAHKEVERGYRCTDHRPVRTQWQVRCERCLRA